MRHLASMLVGSALVLAFGCNHNNAPPASGATTQGGQATASKITTARCEREVTCNNVGEGKSYATKDACMNELGHNAKVDFREEECPKGVNSARVDTCLTDIRNERCGNPIDSLERVESCRRGKLCIGD